VPKEQSGIDRAYATSNKEKSVFILGHLFIILICGWILFFDGVTLADKPRSTLLFAVSVLYFTRHIITLFYLLMRKVTFSEVFGLLGFIAFFEIGLLLVGGGIFRQESIQFGWLDGIALLLLFIGSYLNTFSEFQRKWWKNDSVNKGHCYTGGLFAHSMHINFFGDVVLFTGWVLLTHNLWTLGLPLLMMLSFIFFHIPTLDAYLKKRYKEEFVTYAEKTKKLIPFVY